MIILLLYPTINRFRQEAQSNGRVLGGPSDQAAKAHPQRYCLQLRLHTLLSLSENPKVLRSPLSDLQRTRRYLKLSLNGNISHTSPQPNLQPTPQPECLAWRQTATPINGLKHLVLTQATSLLQNQPSSQSLASMYSSRQPRTLQTMIVIKQST